MENRGDRSKSGSALGEKESDIINEKKNIHDEKIDKIGTKKNSIYDTNSINMSSRIPNKRVQIHDEATDNIINDDKNHEKADIEKRNIVTEEKTKKMINEINGDNNINGIENSEDDRLIDSKKKGKMDKKSPDEIDDRNKSAISNINKKSNINNKNEEIINQKIENDSTLLPPATLWRELGFSPSAYDNQYDDSVCSMNTSTPYKRSSPKSELRVQIEDKNTNKNNNQNDKNIPNNPNFSNNLNNDDMYKQNCDNTFQNNNNNINNDYNNNSISYMKNKSNDQGIIRERTSPSSIENNKNPFYAYGTDNSPAEKAGFFKRIFFKKNEQHKYDNDEKIHTKIICNDENNDTYRNGTYNNNYNEYNDYSNNLYGNINEYGNNNDDCNNRFIRNNTNIPNNEYNDEFHNEKLNKYNTYNNDFNDYKKPSTDVERENSQASTMSNNDVNSSYMASNNDISDIAKPDMDNRHKIIRKFKTQNSFAYIPYNPYNLSKGVQKLFEFTELPYLILWVYFSYFLVLTAMFAAQVSIMIWVSAGVASFLVGIGLNANAYRALTLRGSVDYGMVLRFFFIPFGVSALSGLTHSLTDQFILVFPLDPLLLAIGITVPTILVITLVTLRVGLLMKRGIPLSLRTLLLNTRIYV